MTDEAQGAAASHGRRQWLLGAIVGAAAGVAGFLAGRWTAPAPPGLDEARTEAAALPEAVTITPEAMRNFGLRTAPAVLRPLVRIIRVTGTVGFNELRLAHLNPLARGRIQAIEVAIGERVRAGQRLAILDAIDLADARYQLASAEAALSQAQAEAETARAALQRGQDLVRSGALSAAEVERRRTDLARATAAVQTRTVEIGHWREMLARYTPAGAPAAAADGVSLSQPTPSDARGGILAPFDGAILAIGATPGELVDTAREVFTLADLSILWVMADVPEREIGAIRAGNAVSLTVEAWPGRRFQGRVAYVADQIDPRTGTARVRCEVPNPDGALKINMFAAVEIAAPLDREGVVVPDAALQAVDDQPTVFLRQEEARFAPRSVRPGLRQPDGTTEILEGLEAGAIVATDGSFRLKALLLQARLGGED